MVTKMESEGLRRSIRTKRLYTIDVLKVRAYGSRMVFIETPVFTRLLQGLLDDDAYAALQARLVIRPDAGDLIEGTGGIRKLRVASGGRGKRGGSRVIYYHFIADAQIALLLIYPKNERDYLSMAERAALRRIVERWR